MTLLIGALAPLAAVAQETTAPPMAAAPSDTTPAAVLLGPPGGGGGYPKVTIVTPQPPDGPIPTDTFTVAIEWCDDLGLDAATRSITLNGVDVTAQFTTTSGGAPTCTDAHMVRQRSTGRLTLALGANTVNATIDDIDGWTGTDQVTYARPEPPPPIYAVAVTADAGITEVRPGASSTVWFTAKNVGTVSGTFTFTPVCASAIYSSGCMASPTQATLDTGRTTRIGVTFVARTTVGSSDLVRLRADGTAVDSSWTEVRIAAAPTSRVTLAGTGATRDSDLCLAIAAGPAAASQCGDLRVSHTLPATRTLGTVRAPALLYSVQTALPTPLVAADVMLPTRTGGQLPTQVEARVLIGGSQRASGQWSAADWGVANTVRRIVLPIDASLDATGAPAFLLEVSYRWPDLTYTRDTVSGRLAIVNRRTSPYGAGWWPAGVERLVTVDATTLLWVAGDGSTRLYTQDPVAPTVYRAPKLDRPDSITVMTGGGWIRWAPLRARIQFDQYGRHSSTRNRLGRRTLFEYTGTGATDPIQRIRVPVADTLAWRDYVFNFSAGTLASVTAPGGRTTTVSVVNGVLQAITDPGLPAVTFGYGTGATAYRLGSRTDRRGYATSYGYDVAHRLTQHAHLLRTVAIVPAETRGIPGGSSPKAQPRDSLFTRIDGPRTDVSDLTRYWVNDLGAPVRVRDALDRETVLTYDATWPALATTTRTPDGLTTRARYSAARGLLDTLRVERPLGTTLDFVTAFEWHPRLELPTKVTPLGREPSHYTYDDSTGNRLTQQEGNDPARRVTFSYYSAPNSPRNLLATVTVPQAPADSLSYDALGNVARVRSPLGYHTRFETDAIGRDTLVVSPVLATDFGADAAGDSQRLRQRTAYDAAGRDSLTQRLSPAAAPLQGCILPCISGGRSAMTLSIVNSYDDEGNLTRVTRYGDAQAAGIDSVVTEHIFDELGRLLQETNAGATADYSYDAAGNVRTRVAGDPRTPDRVSSEYDAANRLTRQIIAAKFYRRVECPISSWYIPDADDRHSPCVAAFDSLRLPADTATFSHDVMGRVLTAHNRHARINRTYFPSGLLKTEQLAIRRRKYSVGDQFLQHSYTTRYAYDSLGRRSQLWYPTALKLGGRDSLVYVYHAWGPLKRIVGKSGESYDFAYDSAARLRSLTFPGNVKDTSVFDAEGRLSWRRVSLASGSVLLEDALQFDPRGKITHATLGGSVTRGGGSVVTGYDGAGAVFASQWQNFGDAGAELDEIRTDAHGNIVWKHSVNSGARNDTLYYENDYLGRLLTIRSHEPGATPPYYNRSYRDYDAAGSVSYASEHVVTPSGGTFSSSRSYYGADNRLRQFVRFDGPGNVPRLKEEYWYDALGRRIYVWSLPRENCADAAHCFGAVTRYAWDGSQLLGEVRALADTITEVDGSGGSAPFAGKVAYVHGLGIDRPVGLMRENGTLLVPHVNWRGQFVTGTSSGGATFSSGNIKWPAAQVRVFLDGGTAADWWGSLIQDQLDASGMLYRRNRYYDPTTGQFTQVDPIGIAGGLNVYGFADGDPVNASDPFGLSPDWRALAKQFISSLGLVGALNGAVDRGLNPEPVDVMQKDAAETFFDAVEMIGEKEAERRSAESASSEGERATRPRRERPNFGRAKRLHNQVRGRVPQVMQAGKLLKGFIVIDVITTTIEYHNATRPISVEEECKALKRLCA